MKAVLDQIFSILLNFVPGVPFLGVLYTLLGGMDGLHAKIISLNAMVVAASASVSSIGVAGFYDYANRILPITEGLVMIGVILSAEILAASIRVVKSWIPSVN